MAGVSVINDESMDDPDEGFEQGDCPVGTPEDDASLPPLLRVQKYANSTNVFHRQMVVRFVQDLFRTVPAEMLAADLPEIMRTLTKIGDESILRADLLEQIPHIAAQAQECSSRVPVLKNVVSEYLIPLVVRNLGHSDTAVDKAAHATLILLIEQGFITKQQAEIQVCPSVLALSKLETSSDVNTGAITLMSRLAHLLGRDITERVFLKRFIELCASSMFYVRKVCAAHLGEFCAVVGGDAFEKILLPCYIALCGDEVWGVRKACAEVIMFISWFCPPIARKQLLAPVFGKLLQDDCRWVRISAFQALGPFIATFAEPTITNVAYSKGGELVLVDGEGEEFVMYSSQSLSDRFATKMSADKVEDVMVDLDIMAGSFDSPSNNADESQSAEKDEWYFEGLLHIQGMLEEEEEQEEPNQNNVILVDQKQCDNLDDTIDNELKDVMENLTIRVNNKTAEDRVIKSENVEICGQAGEEKPTNCVGIESNGNNEKVNFPNSKGDTIEDGDLHSFNSVSYWHISPDLPLDPNIIAGEDTSTADDTKGDIASHLEELYSSINLWDNSNSTTTPNNNDTTVSFEEKHNLSSNSECTVVNSIPKQNVVPQLLIDSFISMTDVNLFRENDMQYHCAYSLPAVALTLGSNNWDLLKNTVEILAGDMQYKVRRTIASSLHEYALMLGPEMATDNLAPLFDGFLKDLDEVRIGVLKHLAHFLRLISRKKRITYLPRLGEFLQTDNEWNWRFRQELAKQLLQAVTLFKPADTAKYIGVIALNLLCDKIAAIRQVALSLITQVISYTSTEPELTSSLLAKLAEHFAHSKKWKKRQTFCLLCSELLQQQALPPQQFASEIMPHLLDLSWDPVANVRLVVARCLAKHILTNEYFIDPSNDSRDGLETVLRRLQTDKDTDVRQSAEI